MAALLLIFVLGVPPPAPMEFPAGSFPAGGPGARVERPVGLVGLSAFRIDRTEVSVADFETFVAATNGDTQRRQLRRSDRADDHPVVAVTWAEADAYCRWRGGSLPTEAQWERAACGESGGPYPWGARGTRSAQWSERSDPNAVLRVDTRAVDADENAGTGAAHHLSGNVWEWTADWYHRSAYEAQPGTDPTGPATGQWKTIRGGSFANLPSYCTCSHREPAAPEQVRLTTGFRCVYPAP